MNKDLKKHNINFPIITYDIIPITLTSGIIEIIDNCEFIYDIRKSRYTLLNHILIKNANDTVDSIRNRFMNQHQYIV